MLLHYLVKHWCQQNTPLSCGATNRIHNRLAATSVHGSWPMIHIRSRTAISEPQSVRVHNVCSYMYRHFPLDVPPGMPPEAWRVAGEIVHRVCSSVPNLALIDQGGLVHEPPPKKKKLKANLQYFAFHLRQHAFQIWPGSVMGARLQEPPPVPEITICCSADQHCRWLSNRQFSCFLFQELQRPLPSR